MSSSDSTQAFSSGEMGAEPVIAKTNRPPSRFCRSSAITSASTAVAVGAVGSRRSTSLWYSPNSMSQMRGTKFSWVGRTSARSSSNVDRSLLAAK